MKGQTYTTPSLAQSIIDQIDEMVRDAESTTRPLENEPYRARLFELFVMAEAADYLKPQEADEASATNLTADNLCRLLAARWNLADAARESFASQTRLPPEQLARMRLLWSLMRMWMEWSYAWQRWPEFHQTQKP